MVLLALALISGQALSNDHDRGSNLYVACKADVRALDKVERQNDEPLAVYCLGYLEGITDTADLTKYGICLVNKPTLGTLTRVYVTYMEQHPKMFDSLRPRGVLEAWADTYPCFK